MRFLIAFLLTFSLLFLSAPTKAQDTIAGEKAEMPLLWERPLALGVSSGLLLAGSSTLFFNPSIQANNWVRDNVQAWRFEQFNNAKIKIDNILQYVPLVAVEGLDLLGVPSKHTGWPMLQRVGSTAIVVTFATYSLKYAVHEKRPDSYARNSFPSGHTSFAFAGAELMRLEYGETSPLIPATGYAIAATTGMMRIYNDRHWLGDVLAGAAIGLFSADISYWLNDKLETIYAQRKKH